MTVLHFTRSSLSSSFWPRNRTLKWNTALSIRFGSSWLLVPLSGNNVCLKGTKISGYWRHAKQCDDSAKSSLTTGVPKTFPAVTASLG
jgi:hypothetical protein